MILLDLPVELLLDVGSYLSPEDLISLATTSKDIRRVFMIRVFGGTVHIRSPLPNFPDVHSIIKFVRQGMPGLRKCIEQVRFYRQHDLARHVHTVRITNWAAPSPKSFCSQLAEGGPKYQALLEILKDNPYYRLRPLFWLCSVYDFIVVNLVRLMPLSELELVRSYITPNMHITLTMMPTLRRLTLEDCKIAGLNFPTNAGTGGQYESFKATSEAAKYLLWDDPFTKAIEGYLSLSYSTLTKLEISIEFLEDDALDHLSLPSLTYLAIVPHTNKIGMWLWGTVYRILKISPNITCFRFEPLTERKNVLLFDEVTCWGEYKRKIGNLPLSQLSSITAYRQLMKRLVPGRPVSFVKILLLQEELDRYVNWPDPESDDEDDGAFLRGCIVPPQLVRSTTLVKTLYLQRVNEQEELRQAIWANNMEFLRNACPFATDLWLPSLKITRRRRHYRDPVDAEEILEELKIWLELERCAIGPCSPWLAKELEWFKEGSIIPRRVHPTLEELLLEDDVLWKWQDDSDVTGWVLYISTDIEGSEDSEEAIYSPGSSNADTVSSDSETSWE